ncbi:hypothetical protein [Marinimicrobium sp. ARAG 43.8]|uniref:hypothetical protein n=1 Tax=Marinimicrobium sp. ARAG 43.8 TaxID=3418719 RepID=UPI003CF15403
MKLRPPASAASTLQKGFISCSLPVISLGLVLLLGIAYAVLQYVVIPKIGDGVGEETSSYTLGQWEGVIECEATGPSSALEQPRTILVEDGSIVMERGDIEEFYRVTDDGTTIPRDMSLRFEWWHGVVRGSKVIVQGWYTEGGDRVKPISFDGAFEEGGLYMEGKRGPRKCTISAHPVG